MGAAVTDLGREGEAEQREWKGATVTEGGRKRKNRVLRRKGIGRTVVLLLSPSLRSEEGREELNPTRGWGEGRYCHGGRDDLLTEMMIKRFIIQ